MSSIVALGGLVLKNLSLCYDENYGIPHDISLEISDGYKVEELKVHRFVLALQSEVLEEKIRSSINASLPVSLHSEDIEALKVIIKFCYNIIDPMENKSLHFLITVYKEAENFHFAELQVCFLSFFFTEILKPSFTTRSWF